jgi:alpha-beta hydrolase superfamily lysophospholipase
LSAEKVLLVEETLKKNIDNPEFVIWQKNKWPVVHPVEHIVTDKVTNEKLSLESFFYPSKWDKTDQRYKGIIFYIHGFTEYCGRLAHLAKGFSE